MLDINLPDGNGLDWLTEIRQKSGVPVILISANNMEMDIVTGLKLGANDYITKPLARRNCWLGSGPFSAAIDTAKRMKVLPAGNSAFRTC